MPDRLDVVIVGGGIVGLATARAIVRARPGVQLAILEKESRIARHQTGRNSGVLHSGIYYRPGSQKAAMCVSGRLAMEQFCTEHDVPFERCGKVIVAVDERELPATRTTRSARGRERRQRGTDRTRATARARAARRRDRRAARARHRHRRLLARGTCARPTRSSAAGAQHSPRSSRDRRWTNAPRRSRSRPIGASSRPACS